MKSQVRVLLVGAKGRMGQAIIAAAEPTGVAIAGAIDQGDDISNEIDGCDVVVDFSHPSATRTICSVCLQAGKPLVVGTTGHSKQERSLVEETSKSLPIVFSPNFSVGVNALFWLTRQAAELLGQSFDCEIIESHHHMKKDAPSGTAQRLAEILCDVRKLDYAMDVVHGREGLLGKRPRSQIGVHSIRAGDIVGDHMVMLASDGERLELTHRASSRQTFAAGALRAAQWVIGRAPGLYSMQDVLGL